MATTCPVQCLCHTSPYAPCTEPGGCGSAGCNRTTIWDPAYCRSGDQCKSFDQTGKHPAHVAGAPLCDTCLTAAEPAVRALVYDYLDLAQLQAPSLSQAIDINPGGGHAEAPIPLNAAAEALQAEIVHVLATWEAEIRAAHRLSDPPADRTRGGHTVQRAVTVLAPRLRLLANLPPVAVYPTGCEGQPRDVAGWEAVLHLRRLHKRARGMLGRTQRTFWVPGECSNEVCVRRELYRAEPRDGYDDPPVLCDHCGTWRTFDDYEAYVAGLVWPTRRVGVAA